MKINFNKIICLNLASVNAQQLFAICETYLIGFEELYKRKTETRVSMYWVIETNIVAFIIDGFFFMGQDYKNTSKEDIDRIKKIKPIKTPKMPKTEQALNNYKSFLEEGYDIRTPSMDSKLIFYEKKRELIKQMLSEPSVLETDAILDKISKYRIYSIFTNLI